MRVNKLFCALAIFIASASSADCAAYRFVDIGDPYPAFCAQQFQGDRVCSEKYEDTILVLTFFTLQQTSSEKVMNDLQEVAVRYQGKDLSVIGILSGEADLQGLDEFVRAHTLTFPILLDPDRRVYGDFGVFLYPATGIFARDKSLRYYLPARRINFDKHVDGYVRFLLEEISDSELEAILHPPQDTTDPNYKKAENYHNFARVYYKKGKLDKVKELLELSIQAYKNYALAYSLYGYVYIQEEAYEQGLEQFELALEIEPELQEALEGRQICLHNMSQQDSN